MSEDEARRALKHKRFTVLFSGGKDSTAALLWCCENVPHDDWNVLYVVMKGNTHRLCTKYVVSVCKLLGLERRLLVVESSRDFFDVMDEIGPPLIKYRWCLSKVKMPLFDRYAHRFNVSGIKRADSSERAKRQVVEVVKESKTKRVDVKPIADWDNEKVLRYIRSHGFNLNPCYEKYGNSGNCMFCPYASSEHIIKVMSDPYWGRKIAYHLRKNRARLTAGQIGMSIWKRWMKHENQSRLESFF